MTLSRAPNSVLGPFVDLVWATDGRQIAPAASGRELVLPTGKIHIVFRLDGPPLRLFRDEDDDHGTSVGSSVIGGARARPYLRDVSVPAESVGAMLRPGAAGFLIGAPAGLFSHAHTSLEDVWGYRAVARIRERLGEARTASDRLDRLEALLVARLPRSWEPDPLIAHALARFGASHTVGSVVSDCGVSHRHFTKVFGATVGLTPKTYCRILRFGRALDEFALGRDVAPADLAAAQGYADQPHFNREFRALAGLSPGRYRQIAPVNARHVPM